MWKSSLFSFSTSANQQHYQGGKADASWACEWFKVVSHWIILLWIYELPNLNYERKCSIHAPRGTKLILMSFLSHAKLVSIALPSQKALCISNATNAIVRCVLKKAKVLLGKYPLPEGRSWKHWWACTFNPVSGENLPRRNLRKVW